MATVTIANCLPTFPVGTTVGAYRGMITDSGEPKPLGNIITSGVVNSSGAVTLTSSEMATGTEYVAAAKVSGKWRFIEFTTNPASPNTVTQGELTALLEPINAELAAHTTAIAGKQAGDADLTAIAALSPADYALMMRSGGSWAALAKGNSSQQLIVRSDGTIAYETIRIAASAYGLATGASGAVNAAAFQAALTAAATAQGICLVPGGTFSVNAVSEVDDKVTLEGQSHKASIIKLAAEAKVGLLKSKRLNEGGTTGGTEGVMIRDICFDGNASENVGSTATLVDLDGIAPVMERVEIRGGNINLRTRMSRSEKASTVLEDGFFNHVRLIGSKEYNWLFEGPHDSVIKNVLAQTNEGISLCVKKISVWEGCHSYGNCKHAFEILASSEYNGCLAEGSTEGQVAIFAEGVRWRGGRVFFGGGSDGKIGFMVADATRSANSAQIEGVRVENCTNGAFVLGAAGTGNLRITGWVSGSEGFAVKGSGGSSRYFDLKVTGGMQLAEATSITLPEIASAAELELPNNNRQFNRIPIKVTGAVEIKKWKNLPPAGTEVICLMTSTAKWVDGENLKLAGNFEGAADRTIRLMSDGTNMFEVGRSTN